MDFSNYLPLPTTNRYYPLNWFNPNLWMSSEASCWITWDIRSSLKETICLGSRAVAMRTSNIRHNPVQKSSFICREVIILVSSLWSVSSLYFSFISLNFSAIQGISFSFLMIIYLISSGSKLSLTFLRFEINSSIIFTSEYCFLVCFGLLFLS